MHSEASKQEAVSWKSVCHLTPAQFRDLIHDKVVSELGFFPPSQLFYKLGGNGIIKEIDWKYIKKLASSVFKSAMFLTEFRRKTKTFTPSVGGFCNAYMVIYFIQWGEKTLFCHLLLLTLGKQCKTWFFALNGIND